MTNWLKHGFRKLPERQIIGHPDNLDRILIFNSNCNLSSKLAKEGKPHPTLKEFLDL